MKLEFFETHYVKYYGINFNRAYIRLLISIPIRVKEYFPFYRLSNFLSIKNLETLLFVRIGNIPLMLIGDKERVDKRILLFASYLGVQRPTISGFGS